MNKTKRLFSCLALLGLLTTSQAQTPSGSVMVMPNAFLLIQEGYSSEDGNGTEELDFQKAYNFSFEIQGAGSKIEAELENLDIEVKSFSNVLRSQAGFEMEASLSTIDGQQVYRSPYDKYVQIAQPDILVLFKWKLFTSGKDQYLDFTIEVLDAYTSNLIGSVNKNVASEGFNWNLNNFIDAGIRQSADELRTLLSQELLELETNGREVIYTFRIAQNLSFFDYIDELDLELYEFIDNWMFENAVNGTIGAPRIGETQCQWFPRVPLENDEGAPITADRWIRSLKKELRTYGYSARYNSASNNSNANFNISKLD